MNNEIKEICRKCEYNINCQGKGCAFRSLGNEYCDEVENANNLIKDLQKQNTELKEKILLLKASEPMLEFAKQTYKDNWNKLKEWIKEYPAISYASVEKVNGIVLSGKLIREDHLLDKLQEIEGGMNE